MLECSAGKPQAFSRAGRWPLRYFFRPQVAREYLSGASRLYSLTRGRLKYFTFRPEDRRSMNTACPVKAFARRVAKAMAMSFTAESDACVASGMMKDPEKVRSQRKMRRASSNNERTHEHSIANAARYARQGPSRQRSDFVQQHGSIEPLHSSRVIEYCW